MENFLNSITANRWLPLPLDFVLDKYNPTSLKVLSLFFIWMGVIGISMLSVAWVSPSEFMLLDEGQQTINQFFLFYPPLILGTLLLFWVGFEWGFIPLFLSGFAITFSASVTYYWGLLFGIAFVLGLGIYALAYYCVPFDPALRDMKSFAFYVVVSFFAAIASSLGSFVWSDFFGLNAYETITLWKGWWTGMFLQSVFIVGPVLYLMTPSVSKYRQKLFPNFPRPKVTLGWIYTAIASVAVVLMLFIVGAKILGTETIHQQVESLDAGVGEQIIRSNDSLEIISWISIALVMVLGVGSIYLVGSWNKKLKEKVDLKTDQLKKSQKQLQNALSERDLLLDTIHDRVRNNLTMVLALLELQLKGGEDKSNDEILKDSYSRIRSLALIHETMVQSETFERVNLKSFAIKLSNRLQKSFGTSLQNIEVSMNVQEIETHIDRAVPIAMILNELMVNAFMHGFADFPKGVVFVSLEMQAKELVLQVRDNGRPLPDDFENITKRTLGFKLIRTLVKQLQGTLEIIDKKTAMFEVRVPRKILKSEKA